MNIQSVKENSMHFIEVNKEVNKYGTCRLISVFQW